MFHFPHMLPEKKFRSYPKDYTTLLNQTKSSHPCLCVRQHPASKAQRDGYNGFMVLKDRGGARRDVGCRVGKLRPAHPRLGQEGAAISLSLPGQG